MFSAACSKHSILKVLSVKKIMKISSSIIEYIAVDLYIFVGRILLIYSLQHSRKDPQILSHITSDSNFRIKFRKVLSCMAHVV